MLPFILGGVALAVTGYGMGKFLEEDVSSSQNSIDSYSQFNSSDVIDRFKNMKSELYETTLKELQTALKEMKNLEKDSDIFVVYKANDNQYDSLSLENQVDKYIIALEKAQNFIFTQFDRLDELIMKFTVMKKKCLYKS